MGSEPKNDEVCHLSMAEVESHSMSKQYIVSDLHQTPSDHHESSQDKENENEAECDSDENEFDIPDDDVELNALNDMQKRIIKNKTVLSKKSTELNDQNMRNQYIKQYVSNKQLIDRKNDQKKIIEKYKQNIKKDVKQELVFKFVKQQYLV